MCGHIHLVYVLDPGNTEVQTCRIGADDLSEHGDDRQLIFAHAVRCGTCRDEQEYNRDDPQGFAGDLLQGIGETFQSFHSFSS